MNTTSRFLGALAILAAGLLISLSVFSFAKADRSERAANVQAMCTNEMFCYTPVYYQDKNSRRAVTVPCNAASGGPGFDTPDNLIHIGDYYFDASKNTYFVYVGAGVAATSSSPYPICQGPRFVESSTKPIGMREVHPTGNSSYVQHCKLNGKDIYVPISAEDYAKNATAHGIPPLKIDARQQGNCFYSAYLVNESPRGR